MKLFHFSAPFSSFENVHSCTIESSKRFHDLDWAFVSGCARLRIEQGQSAG